MKRYICMSLFSFLAIFAAGCSEKESTCEDGLVECGGVACVDLTSSRYHCGGCGIACNLGEECVEGVCVCPEGVDCEALVPDLFATCFQAGHLVGFDKEEMTRTLNAAVTGMEGPQTMAILDDDHLVVVGSLDQVLRVVHRPSMQVVGELTLGGGTGATAPNHVIVDGKRAYVVQSISNEVTAVDLSDPRAPKVIASVSTGEGTNPYMLAADGEGTLWVTLWLAGAVLPIEVGADGVEAGEPVAIETSELEGIPSPAGIAVAHGKVYATLNNLDESFAPAGSGRLWVYDPDAGDQTLVDLGPDCTNPSAVAAGEDGRLYVACTGHWGESDGALAIYSPSGVVEVLRAGESPSRLALDGRFVYLADGGSNRLLRLDLEGGETIGRDACPPDAEGMEFVSDVLVYP